ncbi:MAG: ATP-binding protein [Alphaproteobacteria bacterium]|nr:ATP-binding protein [Alphaproteobacteria bacterium]
MISRKYLQNTIENKIERNAVTAILGPRQCGKTTISRIIGNKFNAHYFDLEDPVSFQSLKSSPMQLLSSLSGLIILDEIQRMPDLFPILRVLADRYQNPAHFLILGSASPHLMKNVSESLAGRIGFVDMSGFDIWETGYSEVKNLWFRGRFPRSFLGKNDDESFSWRMDFIRTFLERDIPQLGITVPSETLRRFWTMLAHYHGQTWNGSEFARSLGTTEPTARRYLDLLSGAYVVRQIQPWFENISKRQVKSPKVYIADSGILHALLMLREDQIQYHPKRGASWEGFVIDQIIRRINAPVYYWATHAGAELDLFSIKEGKRIGFEIKYSDAPSMTKSMHTAIRDLHLDHLYVIYPGEKKYPIHDGVMVLPISELESVLSSSK